MGAPTQRNGYVPNKDLEDPTFILSFAGGLNENQTPLIQECSAGYNFELGARNSKFIPRKPFDRLGYTPNSGKITGIMQLVTKANLKTTIVVSGNTVYKWDGTSAGFTALATVNPDALLRGANWTLTDTLYITDVNLNNVVKKWNGTTFSNSPTNLPTPLFAKYAISYLNRMWYFNVTSGTATPHLMLASTFNDPENLSLLDSGGPTTSGGSVFATGLEAFYLLTPDLKPINGVALYQNTLIISTLGGSLFQLTGTDASTFQFIPFYNGSAAIDNESIVNIGNDVIFIEKGGAIQQLSATNNFGDVRTNALSSWLPITSANITASIIVYEQFNQKVYFFIKDKCLVLYKDILFGGSSNPTAPVVNLGMSPWSVYTTQLISNLNTQAAASLFYPLASNNDQTVIWGDAYGQLWDMNGSGPGDGGLVSGGHDVGFTTIDTLRQSRLIDVEVFPKFPYNENILVGKVQYRRLYEPTNLKLSFNWSDEYNTSESTVPLKSQQLGNNPSVYGGHNYYGGGSYWSQGEIAGFTISHQTFSPTGKGGGFYLTAEVNDFNPFELHHIELY